MTDLSINTHRLTLHLYTSSDCPLCDRLECLVRPYLDDAGLTLHKRRIDAHADWAALYGKRIPVFTLGDRVVLEGRPDEAQVVAAMKAAGFTH